MRAKALNLYAHLDILYAVSRLVLIDALLIVALPSESRSCCVTWHLQRQTSTAHLQSGTRLAPAAQQDRQVAQEDASEADHRCCLVRRKAHLINLQHTPLFCCSGLNAQIKLVIRARIYGKAFEFKTKEELDIQSMSTLAYCV